MTTQMVRKQIYIQKRQEILLKRLSQARGLSEAEVIRQAIDRETGRVSAQPAADRSAWQEWVAFLDSRRRASAGKQPLRWNREEIYAGREGRWLHDKEED
jgi:hypothetical protein